MKLEHIGEGEKLPEQYRNLLKDTDALVDVCDAWIQYANYLRSVPETTSRSEELMTTFAAYTSLLCAICDTGEVRVDSKPIWGLAYTAVNNETLDLSAARVYYLEAIIAIERLIQGRMLLDGKDPSGRAGRKPCKKATARRERVLEIYNEGTTKPQLIADQLGADVDASKVSDDLSFLRKSGLIE